MSRPLRILRIISRLNVGGPALHVIFLTQRFQEIGWSSELVTGAVGSDEGSMEVLAEERDIHLEKIPELRRDVNVRRDLVALYKLIRLMFRMKPDIVHTHTAKAGALGRIAAFLYRRFHWRGLWSPRPLQIYHTFHGHVLYGYFSPLRTRLYTWMEKILARISTRLITLSPQLQTELVQMGVAPPEKVSIVPLGLEIDSFLSLPEKVPAGAPIGKEMGLPPGIPVVGIIGRLVPIKDHETFLEAACILKYEMTEGAAPSAHFLIVGDGELREILELRAREKGISECCHFLGWRRDLPPIYNSLDLVVLSSRNEGTPVSLIESMAAARPVVATRVGGVPDVLGDGNSDNSSQTPIPFGDFQIMATGVLIEEGDAFGLARAMAHLLNSPALSESLGRAGRRKARSLHTSDRLRDDLAAIYAQDQEFLAKGKMDD